MNKKTLLAVLAILAMSATMVFTSCGSDDDEYSYTPPKRDYTLVYVISNGADYTGYSTFTANIYDPLTERFTSFNCANWNESIGYMYGQNPKFDKLFKDIVDPIGMADFSKHNIYFYVIQGIGVGDEIKASVDWTLDRGKLENLADEQVSVASPNLFYMVFDKNDVMVAPKGISVGWPYFSIEKDSVPNFIGRHAYKEFVAKFAIE